MPPSMKHVTSLLRHVAIPRPAASYNPSADAHQKFLNELSLNEMQHQRKEDHINKSLSLPSGQSYVTAAERFVEEMEGLQDATGDAVDERNDPDTITVMSTKKTSKSKKKQKRRKLDGAVSTEKAEKRRLNQVFRAKTLNKELQLADAHIEEMANRRKTNKKFKRLTTAQRLGKGKFEEQQEEFLLNDELVGNLRQLQPQGCLLSDRMNSLQKRNIIPVAAGRRKKSQLKKKLRVKERERRSYQQVQVGSRVI